MPGEIPDVRYCRMEDSERTVWVLTRSECQGATEDLHKRRNTACLFKPGCRNVSSSNAARRHGCRRLRPAILSRDRPAYAY